jgi:hypothetical protein
MRRLPLLLLLLSGAAAAQDAALTRGLQDLNAGRMQRAAAGFRDAAESAAGDDRAKAEYLLAQSLERLGLPFSAFFQYARIVQSGPAHAYWLKAVEGAALAAAELHDEVVAPNLFAKAYSEQISGAPSETLARIHASLALFAYRAGKPGDAARFAGLVPPGTRSWPQARYVAGLVDQRADPEKAVQTFRALSAMPAAPGELRELANIALGRTLYGLHRYAEASAVYARLPRFSRHWDEALFEGAYADLQNGDPGAALGKLHSLHSPHLKDEFVPESLNLAAIIFHQRCLYPYVRGTLAQFDREVLPLREQIKTILGESLPVEEHWRMLARGDTRLPAAVQHHLQKNERVASFRAHLAALESEAARIRGDGALRGTALGGELLEQIARHQDLTAQLAGKFVQGRLADMARLIDVLQGDEELIAFETTKGEKEMLENRFDAGAQLAAQRIHRPAMPPTGHEYWPFDGEYWPDEIGYYRYTLKDACARRAE